jgi:amino acid adenylation domain-containing protein/non-ribosomal peptide synthase protein (TIGR01720 family)
MVPSAFVFLDSLPLTRNGKVDRRALPEPHITRRKGQPLVAPRDPVEATLAEIWAELLQPDQVGIYDNFFELGGDSILVIQMLAAARKAGIHLTPRQVFECQTIAQLAKVAGTAKVPQAEQRLVTGTVLLTPIQRWFFEHDLPNPNHWNQAVLLDVLQPLNPGSLRQAVEHLLIHHDALRLRFIQQQSEWHQTCAAPSGAVPFTWIDLADMDEEARGPAIEKVTTELQSSLDLGEGPLLRVAYLSAGQDSPGRLFLVVHHLAVDGVSLRILMDDLCTAYALAARGEPIRLSRKTTSWKRWAERLAEHARSPVVASEIAYWTSQPWAQAKFLPVDFPARDNTEDSARTVTVLLTAEETRTLLENVPEAYRTHVDEVLLTALAQVLTDILGGGPVIVDLEGHGREPLFDDVDVSRTVGWFTIVFPMLLALEVGGRPAEGLKAVKESVRRVPRRGLGYGLLRYLSDNEKVACQLRALPQAGVCFNYLGQLDQSLPPSYGLARESTGSSRAPGRRRYLLEVTASVFDQRFQVGWTYSSAVHRAETVETLARQYLEALRQLIAHCIARGAGGYTPSDFPLARLDQQRLDQLAGPGKSIEDIYPLSPVQQGFLLHSLYASKSGVGVEQAVYNLQGNLNVEALTRAWNRLVERHAVLRTRFVIDGLQEPLQVVQKHAPMLIGLEDWRGLSADEQKRRLELELQGGLQAGFDLSRPPLMRVRILRISCERFLLAWEHHHLLLDGWSVALVLREVIALYEAFSGGEEPLPECPRPYRDYITWIAQRDHARAETYWRKALRGFRAPTPLVVDRPLASRSPVEQGHREQTIQLSADATAALNAFAQQQHITLNAILQGAWALLLSNYSGHRDVVFGITVSGRPPELAGVESMVGLFISVLPVRVQVTPDAPLACWLRELHNRQLEQREHEHAPLLRIQDWSEVPAGLPLFQSILVLENYPVQGLDQAVDQSRGASLAIREVITPIRTRYRLTLVAAPGSELALHASHDARELDEDAVGRLLGHLKILLEEMVANPQSRLTDLWTLTAQERRQVVAEWAGFYLLDKERRPVPVGVPGEVFLGPSEANGKRLVENLRRGVDLTRTGLMARYRSDGTLEYLGREGNCIEKAGLSVWPGELEAAMLCHPDIQDVAVADVEVEPGSRRLMAYFVATPEAAPSPAELWKLVNARFLAPLVPEGYIRVDKVPRTTEGSVDQQLLPTARPDDLTGGDNYLPPRTPTQKVVADLWAELLGVRRVGVHDNFFELGGDSVLVIQMLSRLRKTIALELTVGTVFEAATVASIAWVIDKLKEQSAGPAVFGPATSSASVFQRFPLRRLPARTHYDLSPYQYPEYYFARLAPDSPMYNILVCDVLFTGDLDVPAMAGAWERVINRHGVFRTRFGLVDGKPIQIVGPPQHVTAEDIYLDYTWVADDQFVEETTRLAHEYADSALDFDNGPMFRVKLAEFSGKRFLLLFLTNHVLWDEVSSLNMAYELMECYNSARAGRQPCLPELAVDYVDYAEWLTRAVQAGVLERERKYWYERFADNPAPLDLPTDYRRPPQQTFNGSDVSAAFPRDLRRRILDGFLTQHRNVTLSMFLHAVLNLLLYRLSGQTDIVLGMPIANRGDQRLEPVLGPFATAMLMRCQLTPRMTFADLLEHTRHVTIEALDHYAYPSVLAIQEINPRWDVSRGRLFSVMYGLQHNKTRFWSELHFDGTQVSRVPHLANIGPLHSTARCDLRFIVEELNEDLYFSWSYNSDLFRRSTIERVSGQYLRLVDQVLRDPHVALANYNLLSQDEERNLQEDANGGTDVVDLNESVTHRFETQVALHPNRVALTWGNQSWSYRELEETANRWARFLIAKKGVAVEDRVGVILDPSPELVVALLAILKAGAAYVPLAHDLPAARQDHILAASDARLVLTQSGLVAESLAFPGQLVFMDRLAEEVATWPAERPPPSVDARNLAVVFFTSGTTGAPKGILLEQRGLVNVIGSTQHAYSLGPDDAMLFVTPYYFDASILDLFWPLAVGARIVIAAGVDAKSPQRISQLICAHSVTVLQTVPIMLDALVEARENNQIADLASLRLIICGSAPLGRHLRDRFIRAFTCSLANHYGPTEVTVDASRFDTRVEMEENIVPIGRPIANTRIYILDRNLQPVPPGVTGEIYISSVGLARGYLREPDRTAAAFLPDPLVPWPAARMYRTGDFGRQSEDGTLHFLGRMDRQVKVRGNRVEVEEVEEVLQRHSAIARCAVRHYIADPTGAFLVAYVELREHVNVLATEQVCIRVFTLRQRPDLQKAADTLHRMAWPDFFAGDETLRANWPKLSSDFPHYQLVLTNEKDEILGVGNAIPIEWDGTIAGLPRGWDEGLRQGVEQRGQANALLVLAGVVGKERTGLGLGMLLLKAFKALATAHGLARILVPVRPTGKSEHPEMTFEQWCAQRRSDGLPADSWLRVHERLGARWLRIDTKSQLIRAPLAQWEIWGKCLFPTSGQYNVKHALQPVLVNVEEGWGEYHDPCVWMEHTRAIESTPNLEPIDAFAIREYLRRFLPEYMVPEYVRFVSRVPLTPTGKVNLQALPAIDDGEERPLPLVPPQNPVQERLASIWKSVLRIDAIGVTDDFFEAGGHSIRAVEMLACVADIFQVTVPLRQFFEDPTIRGLEKVLACS